MFAMSGSAQLAGNVLSMEGSKGVPLTLPLGQHKRGFNRFPKFR